MKVGKGKLMTIVGDIGRGMTYSGLILKLAENDVKVFYKKNKKLMDKLGE